MGTNYYLKQPEACPTCGAEKDKSRHIGKSSAGWAFALHVYPEDGINSLSDWLSLLFAPDARIVDEYGRVVPAEELMPIIIAREGVLARASGAHCVGHGGGSYDYITGDFS